MIHARVHQYLAALCVAISLFLLPSAALADECNDRVIDAAGVFGTGFSQVDSAAQRLERGGADVRVRTIRSFGSHGTLDAYEAAMTARCPSWQAPNGNRKSNLIVFMMSLQERKAGLYYGSAWSARLDGQWTSLLSNDVGPRWADGDFTGGFVAGLDGVRTMIAPRAAPASPGEPSRPTTVVNEAPTDLTGLWWVLGIMTFIAALVLLVLLISRVRRARAERKAAQQQAKLNKQACAAGINELEQPFTMLQIRVNDAASKVSDGDAKPLLDGCAAAKAKFDAATSRFGELDTTASDPDRDGLSKEEYGQIAAAYQGVLDMIRDSRSMMSDVERRVTDLKKKIDEAPARIEKADKASNDAVAFVSQVEGRGFRVEAAEALLQDAEISLGGAREALEAKKYGDVFGHCTQAETHAQRAKDAAAECERRKAALDAAIAEFPALFTEVEAGIREGRENFRYVSENFSDRCWETIRGNGTEAEKRLADAKETVGEATEAATMDAQQWDAAEASVQEARKLLSDARSLLRSITELRAQLDRAKAEIGAEIAAAQADIDAAVAYERTHDADIDDGVKKEIAAAKRKLEEARDELAAHEKPDYIVAIKAAMSANDMADRVLEKSRSQHEAMERKRRKLASTVREAERSISAAKEYIEDHRSDVDSDADAMLRSARSYLAQYAHAESLDSQLDFADKADKAADKALDMAKSDFRQAEEAREEARRRARRERERREREAAAAAAAVAASISSSSRRSSSSSSSWGSGGGGSIGFGGFGGGGGGSTGFGGSGGGGGGSVGW